MSTTPEIQSLAMPAKALAPTLRRRAAETNQLRRMPDSTWKDLVETGIVRGLQPARWGGGELHPREFYSGNRSCVRRRVRRLGGGNYWRASLADHALLK
jgi:hypothetical protein